MQFHYGNYEKSDKYDYESKCRESDCSRKSMRKVKNYAEGTVALMCPYCFKIYYKDIIVRQKTLYGDNDNIEVFNRIGYNINDCICGNGYIHPIELDANIAPIISILNRNGYHTLYCCEGHKLYDDAYIYFKDDSIIKYFDYLPLSWHLDNYEYKENNKIIIRSEFKHGKEYLDELYEFVNQLPIVDTSGPLTRAKNNDDPLLNQLYELRQKEKSILQELYVKYKS